MESTYVNIMIQSLHKKVKVLEEIKSLNQLQKALLEDERSSVDEVDKTVEDKSACIKQLEQLDDGFETLFAKVKEALNSGCKKDAPGSFINWLYDKSSVYAFEMPGKRYDIGNLESYELVNKTYNGIEERR